MELISLAPYCFVLFLIGMFLISLFFSHLHFSIGISFIRSPISSPGCSGISTHSIKHSELGLYIFIPSNDPRSLHRTFINSFSLIITTLFSYTQSWHFCYKISMCHISHHARNIQKQLTCQLNTFLISLKIHAIKVSITMFRVRHVVLRNALYVSQHSPHA